jgi:hypothetical protein
VDSNSGRDFIWKVHDPKGLRPVFMNIRVTDDAAGDLENSKTYIGR